MQGIFHNNNEEYVKLFRASLSEARFSLYLSSSNNDVIRAIQLYHWNTILSQSLYISLHMWEVVLRNKINDFLCWKYNKNWPFDARAVRQLTAGDNKKLQETIERQRQTWKTDKVSTDAVVADLSAGFWVSLLTTRAYDIPFVWRYNLTRIFAYATLDRDYIKTTCGELLVLRNKVAHHEAIFQLNVRQLRKDLEKLLSAMCPAAAAYMEETCTFEKVWLQRPSELAA